MQTGAPWVLLWGRCCLPQTRLLLNYCRFLQFFLAKVFVRLIERGSSDFQSAVWISWGHHASFNWDLDVLCHSNFKLVCFGVSREFSHRLRPLNWLIVVELSCRRWPIPAVDTVSHRPDFLFVVAVLGPLSWFISLNLFRLLGCWRFCQVVLERRFSLSLFFGRYWLGVFIWGLNFHFFNWRLKALS